MSKLGNKSVLVINGLWQPIGVISPKKALVAMNSQGNGKPLAAKGIDIDYKLNNNGDKDLSFTPILSAVTFEEWILLPVRKFDEHVQTAKVRIRMPTVVQAINYMKMPKRDFKPTLRNLYELYDARCYWTGKKLSFSSASREHLKPKSQGGRDTVDNVVLADKNVNSERGTTPVHKFKYKPQYELKKPLAKPVMAFLNPNGHPDWAYFFQ